MYVADVITVQACHIIERRSCFVENGFERREDVLHLTAKIGRKPSLGVGPDDAGDDDLVADPDCRRILVSFGGRLKRGRYDCGERLWHWVSPLKARRSFASMEIFGSAYGNRIIRSLTEHANNQPRRSG